MSTIKAKQVEDFDQGVQDAGAVMKTGTQTITGTKHFQTAPTVPAEAYGSGWSNKDEPATKKDIYNKLEQGSVPVWG